MKLTENVLRKLIIEAISQQKGTVVANNGSFIDLQSFKDAYGKSDQDYYNKLVELNSGTGSDPSFKILLQNYGVDWKTKKIVPNPDGGRDITIGDAIKMLGKKFGSSANPSAQKPEPEKKGLLGLGVFGLEEKKH